MSLKTKIQWADSTVNPTMGCDGCELWGPARQSCYAGTLHVRFGGASAGYARTFEEVTPFPGRMAEAAHWADLRGKLRPDKPWLDGFPRLIFVSDMSDALSASVSFEYLEAEVIANIDGDLGRRHRWLWLTKRPDRMARFSDWLTGKDQPWPPNLWAGTSLTAQGTTGRIKDLLNVGDARTIRFLSVEPQVEAINLGPRLSLLDWVIQGGESGRRARPFDLNWAINLAGQCRLNRVPFFLKQLGSNVQKGGRPVSFRDNHAGDWSEWPESLRIRRMPAID